MRIVPVFDRPGPRAERGESVCSCSGARQRPGEKTRRKRPEGEGSVSKPERDRTNDQSRDARGERRGACDEIFGEGQTRAAKAETKAARKSSTTTPTGTTTVVTPTTPMSQSVKNPKLEARLLALLPPNTTIQEASQGFKNWGQFVAATHVSNNLNIPFAELKARMTGITPGALADSGSADHAHVAWPGNSIVQDNRAGNPNSHVDADQGQQRSEEGRRRSKCRSAPHP